MSATATEPKPATARPKLNPAVARAIVAAVTAYKRANRAFEEAKLKKQLLSRYSDLVPRGVDVEGAGHIIKRWRGGGGEVFSLKDYREAGHTVTAEMEQHIHERDTYDVWDIQPIEGPPEPPGVRTKKK